MNLLADQLREARDRIEEVTARIAKAQNQDPLTRRLATIPGIGTLSSSAFAATTPEVENFGTERDYAAWLGLTPQTHSSGERERILRTDNRYLRRLLYLGAMMAMSRQQSE
ncbi:transposase [Palleronia aestuarii]|uniref:Transposase n=1 Tax=Palleronia aestuarii TaxID=568105 RepID=A0A2W7MUG5_9RHOB|nr:transposase [Palleronia aestuarii]PZX09817.1 transposase [Palleronia aestuarii]